MMEPEVQVAKSNDDSKHRCELALSQEGLDDEGHVHFSVDQVIAHESEILTHYAGEDIIHVHLGFLQFKHCYEVTFCIKDNLYEDIECDPLQNLHVKMEKYQPTEDGEGHQLTILFNAHKEKLMEETLRILDKKDSGKSLTLVFHARVLGLVSSQLLEDTCMFILPARVAEKHVMSS
ncbi:uncharacterized protein LOC121383202 isoform X2 [Gigantopelta aegis]|uniref:uncharacterized protein LOC121383202 isoform X2 n=1 Tax=Gigantopelta aegis TaxID=1735272 RepID=UPI001B88CB37|nr:uncharacterized protein LOC121383202 isoform X2 [Gigantopelta aegis]